MHTKEICYKGTESLLILLYHPFLKVFKYVTDGSC